MNARYVEAMALAMKKDDPVFSQMLTRGELRETAAAALAAVIAELRADPIAADLLAAGNISHTGADLLARLCDYLAGDA